MGANDRTISRRGVFGLTGALAASAPVLLTTQPVQATPTALVPAAGPSPECRPDDPVRDIAIRLEPEVTLVPPTDEVAQYPNSFAWDIATDDGPVRKVMVGVNLHVDDANADSSRIYFTSTDAGQTWQRLPATAPSVVPRIQLRDGTLMGFGYYSYIVPDSGDLKTTITWSRSTDNGETYETGEGVLTSDRPFKLWPTKDPDVWRTISIHDRAWEDSDGTICQPAYGRFGDDATHTSVLLVTSDRGMTWSIRSTIAYAPDLLDEPFATGYEGQGEPNVVRLDDGSLLAVMRTGSWRPICFTRSDDNGHTWSEVEMLKAGAGDHTSIVPGVNPKIRILPNGCLVLMTGRDLVRLYISPDGRGETWLEPAILSDGGFESGNGGLEVLSHNRVVVIGDKRNNNRPKDPDVPYHIWSRVVTVNRRPRNLIDIRRGIADGAMTVSTDLTHTDPAQPGVGREALFDGFSGPERNAIATEGKTRGAVTIDLGRPHTITEVGVAGCDNPQQVVVEISADGTRWRNQQQAKIRGTSVTLIPINATARHVRIRIVASTGPATIGEVEVLTNAITFTHDAAGAPPHGFDASDRAVVVDHPEHGAVLDISSVSDSDPQHATYTFGRLFSGVTIALRLMPLAIPKSLVAIQVLGHRITDPLTTVHGANLGIMPDGALRAHNGNGWLEILPPGAVSFGQWSDWTITCPVDRLRLPTVSIDGGSPVETRWANTVMWDLASFRVNTSVQQSNGQHVLVDDLSVTELSE